MPTFIIYIVVFLAGVATGYAFRGKERTEIGVAATAVKAEVNKL